MTPRRREGNPSLCQTPLVYPAGRGVSIAPRAWRRLAGARRNGDNSRCMEQNSSIDDLLARLNPEQRQAATHGDGPLLIVAGAGTGKTATLVHRVAWLIAAGRRPGRILLLTFTRRAAGEMLRRVDERLLRRTAARRTRAAVWGGTFHAIATRLLRLYGKAIGLRPAFTILDRGDAEDLMGVVRTELGLAKSDRRFPQKGTCMDIYSRCVNAREKLDAGAGDALPLVPRLRRRPRSSSSTAYVDRKEAAGVLDYDDLLLYWHGLLDDREAGRSIRGRFDCVLVDEYQDTNRLQAEILQACRPEGKGLTVVGDDAQSIYSFRAATVRNILDFPKQYPGTTIVTLEQNYRSTQPILDATNQVIGPAAERYTKNLWSQRPRAGRSRVLVTCEDEDEQTEFVVRRILEHREAGVAAAAAGGAVPGLASQHGAGGGAGPAEHPLSQVRRAEVRGDGARQGPAGLPAPGREPARRGGRHAGAAAAAGHRAGQGPAPDGPCSTAAGGRFRRLAGLEAAPGGRRALAGNWSGSCGAWPPRPRPWPAQLHRVRTFYAPLLEAGYDHPQPRLRDLEQLEEIACALSQPAAGCWPKWRSIRPASTQDLAGPPVLDDDYLVLSTIHSAKGLEWDAVYVIHAADGNIPSDMATGQRRRSRRSGGCSTWP